MSTLGRVTSVCLLWAIGILPAESVRAVIVDDSGTAIRHTAAPDPGSTADAGWQLQGLWGGYLGTPIAPNYFITAAHVGGSAGLAFQFQGNSYTIDATYGSGGVRSIPGTDLNVWKITGTFNTFAELYSTQNEVGQHLVVIGRGTAPGEAVMVDGQLRGWLWADRDGRPSWGENDVTSIVTDPGVGDLLQFEFNDGAGPNEAHLSDGDSGGAVFIKDNGIWKLAGINYAVDGPYSTSASGGGAFNASLFDKKGLYELRGTDWVFNSVDAPGASYSSRISINADSIESIIPGPAIPLTLSSLTFTDSQSYSTLGNVKVVLFDSSGGNARLNANAPGAQSLTKPLILASNTDLLFTAGGTLTISGQLDNSAGLRMNVGGGGTLVISGPQIHGTGAMLHLDASSLVLNTDAGSSTTRTLTIDAGPGSTVRLNSTQHLAALSLTGASASLAHGAGLVLDSLQLASSGTLDVGDNFVILHYTGVSPLFSMQQWLASAALYTSAPTAPGTAPALALVDNRTLHLLDWHGEPLSDGADFSQLLLVYTYLGDTNLDGKVDAQDYLNIVANMGKAGASWFDGDLNGDGVVGPADYSIVAMNLGAGTATGSGMSLPAIFGPGSVTTVPEPGRVALLGVGALSLIRRHRRS